MVIDTEKEYYDAHTPGYMKMCCQLYFISILLVINNKYINRSLNHISK